MSKTKADDIDLRDLLRAKSLRATPARIAVLRQLMTVKHPVSHLELTEVLEVQGFEKSTLFRSLVDLTAAELLRKLELGDHVWRFEWIDPASPNAAGHAHLLCVDCGHVQCLVDGQVELKAARSLGTIESVLLKGHCKACR